MAWTEIQVDMLKTLWADGHSASQIAAQIGGITRNAVIGKIHRLGLAERATPVRRTKSASTRQSAPRVSRKTAGVAVAPERAQASTGGGIARKEPAKPQRPAAPQTGTTTVLDIRDSMCKWPIGDPSHPDFAFCGRPKRAGTSYCQAHAEIAYQPIRKREAG